MSTRRVGVPDSHSVIEILLCGSSSIHVGMPMSLVLQSD